MGLISIQIPQVGQPDLTEDPKVASGLTTIQNVINGGLDSTNLSNNPLISTITAGLESARPSPTTLGVLFVATDTGIATLDTGTALITLGLFPTLGTVNTTVKKGQNLVMANGGTVATLPATGALANGVLVGVTAGPAITATSPIAVPTNSGAATIMLPNANSGVSSFTLGTPGAFWIGSWDSANTRWRTVAGGEDTGWVPLSAGPNATSIENTPAVRRVNGHYSLQGTYSNTGGAIAANGTIATIPSGFRPAGSRTLCTVPTGAAITSFIQIYVNSSGVISPATAWSNLGAVTLNGCEYEA